MAEVVKFGRPKGFFETFERRPGSIKKNMSYCPGCGHGVLHKLIAEAMADFGIQDKTTFISPVGCSVFAYYYFDCFGLQVPHGRSAAAATGLTQLPERTARQLILAGTVPALMVTLALQLSFCRAGGDWYEFGPSGNFLEAAAAELDTCSPETPLNVTIVPGSPAADKKLDDIAVNFIFWRHQVPDGLPVKLVIDWRDGRFVREIQLP